jgi:hypothetical protein
MFRPRIALRILAHILGIVSTLLLLAFAFGGGESMRPKFTEAIGLLLFPGGVILGFAVAWWREGLGGWISVGSLALFYGWMYAVSGRLNIGPYFVLFALPGFLHVANSILGSAPKAAKKESIPGS